MTWHAQSGEIVLEGDEARLFREAILYMGDIIEGAVDDDESFFDGAKLFDRMSRSQQIASLELVARYLFRKTPVCLPLTAWCEATLASILQVIRMFVETEIDERADDSQRQVILSLVGLEEPMEDEDDVKEWQWVLDAYEDRFLWDADFENDHVADLPPEQAQDVRLMMGVPQDYNTAIPPDLEYDRDVQHGRKLLMMAIDGKKTIRMTAVMTCEVPASMEIGQGSEGLPTLDGYFPSLIIMRDLGDGEAMQVSDGQEIFFVDGSEVDHSIEEL